ncbi:MAG: xylulose kinase [Actinobacteria bacterium]|nr:xylulose kinase [Actinomycetota bacterium]
MAEVTVGLDIGTTSVKGVVADAEGNVLARTRVPHALRAPSAARLEHDAAEAWFEGPRRALEDLDARECAGVAVAAMVPSLCAVDGFGRPAGPGLLYGDERGRGDRDPTAPPGMSGEAIGFLRWVAEATPDARGYWPAQAVANFALGHHAAFDSATAASLYPLFDGTGWDADQLAPTGARPDQMADVAGLGEVVGRLPDGAPLASGLVDALGEQLVSGASQEGDVLVICGATLLTWALVSEYRAVERLWTIPHTVPGIFLIGGASNAGGIFLNWARALLAEGDDGVHPEAVPLWEPYPRGERTPLHDPARRAVLRDLDLTHGTAAVRRAAYEAAGFVVRQHLELADVGARRLVATGGGTRDPAWMQALADCTGLPVDVVAVAEGGALGAAFVARLAAGLETDFTDGARWARQGTRVEPDLAWTDPVAERYARFLELSGG